MVFNKLDHSLLLASLSILKLRCLLLHENLTVLLAPTNQPPIKCKKIQLDNSYEPILDEDMPYSIIVKNIAVEETKDMFKVFAML